MKDRENVEHRSFRKIIAIAVIFGLLGGASIFGLTRLSGNGIGGTVTNTITGKADSNILQTSVVTGASISSTGKEGVSAVAEKVLPSIVQIQVTATQQVQDAFGRSYEQQGSGSGSGIIIKKSTDEILIVTNNHVVENSTKVTIQFNDDNKVQATVKGTNANSDLAVVSVKGSDVKSETMAKIVAASLGDSSKLKVGENAIAVGNAMGYGTSVTVGYISALNREIKMEDGSMKLIQTDAAINPGNSGGALVNANGQVIGINSAKFASTEVEGMGFAIPISTAVPIINQIINKETIPDDQKAYLGIKGSDVTEEYKNYYGIPIGIYIQSVTKDSPAEKAGLQKGQVITKVNDTTVKTMEELTSALDGIKAGTKGTIILQESGSNNQYKEKQVSVTFGAKSDSSANS